MKFNLSAKLCNSIVGINTSLYSAPLADVCTSFLWTVYCFNSEILYTFSEIMSPNDTGKSPRSNVDINTLDAQPVQHTHTRTHTHSRAAVKTV